MICSMSEALAYLILVFCPMEFEIVEPELGSTTSEATSSYTDHAVRYSLEGVQGDPVIAEEEVAHSERLPHSHGETSRSVWDDLADCESGNWIDEEREFETGSARWYWARPGTEVPPWGTTIHHGGLQFHPDTWSWVAPMVGLGHIKYAYDATREEQILVAEKVLELQGWGAWPTCAKMLGLR